LTGAGVSTESGLPDYRSHDVGLFARTTYKPITIQAFLKDPDRRQAYWARNFIAWPGFRSSEPNVTHFTLTEWQRKGLVSSLVTQNVDRLHQKAGSIDVIELHGNSAQVQCISCCFKIDRDNFQIILNQLNPDFKIGFNEGLQVRPDGDIQISPQVAELFKYPSCPECNGILKPTVVFFGENVPKEVVNSVYSGISKSQLLLILGSSLQVYSGYRFVLHALENAKPVVIVNIGPTRADHLSSKSGVLFVRGRVGEVVSRIKP